MVRSFSLFAIILATLPLPLGLASPSNAAMAGSENHIPGPVPALVERVVDGDTVRVRAQIWLKQELEVSVRIANIDAPELFRPKCPAEKERARAAKSFVQTFFTDGQATLHDIEPDKYGGRVVARVINSEGQDLGPTLVAADHAVSGKRGTWCS